MDSKEILKLKLDGNLQLSNMLDTSGTSNDTAANLVTTCMSTIVNGTNAIAIAPANYAWGLWRDWYYPNVIKESYPVYIQEQAKDKGKQAFEVIKHLQDKKLMKLDTVKDFIDAMDTLLKIL